MLMGEVAENKGTSAAGLASEGGANVVAPLVVSELYWILRLVLLETSGVCLWLGRRVISWRRKTLQLSLPSRNSASRCRDSMVHSMNLKGVGLEL